jgi:hypothetical protein
VDLPQTIMRPFWHPETIKLDDRQFCMRLDEDRPWLIAMLMLVMSFALLGLASIRFFEIFNAYNQQQIYGEKFYVEVAIAGGLLVGSLLGFYLFYRINQRRFICFRRETRSIFYSSRGLIPKYQERAYDEFQGTIKNLKSIFGKRKSMLALIHKDRKQSVILIRTTANPQSLAGFWSFIVQYMKEEGPLPDVPALYQYPNRTPGVIHHGTIDYT